MANPLRRIGESMRGGILSASNLTTALIYTAFGLALLIAPNTSGRIFGFALAVLLLLTGAYYLVSYLRSERLTAFMRCSACRRDGGEPDAGEIEKLDRLAKEGTEAVHVGVCALDRASGGMCPGMRRLAEECRARGMEVVLRTH